MKTLIIGAGRAGCSLAAHLKSKGKKVSVFKRGGSLLKSCAAADIIFIAVPDGEIDEVFEEAKKAAPCKIIAHLSGSHEGFNAAHPLTAIPSKKTALSGVTFTLTGPDAEKLAKFFKSLGNDVVFLDKEKKALYHAACVTASNLVLGTLKTASDMFSDIGFSEEKWKDLVLKNILNFHKNGLVSALTGPVERNDFKTVKKHLKVLKGNKRNIYKLLSKEILKTAKQKNPSKNYSQTEKLL